MATAGVTLPLSEWDAMVAEVRGAGLTPVAPVTVLHRDRSLEGEFERGVLSATVTTTVDVLVPGHLQIPVVDGRVSVGQALLDGRPTSLLRDGEFYTVGVAEPGVHRVRVDLFQGRDHDRFGRGVDLQLPPGGPTQVQVRVPEVDIEATLGRGVVVGHRPVDAGTLVVGQLDASGQLDLSWQRRTLHQVNDTKTEVELHALFTLHDALVTGVADVSVEVDDGEIDRVDLEIPEGMEVVRVTGDPVLQWHASGSGELAILLRGLASDHVNMKVHFQFPVDIDHPVELQTPVAVGEAPFHGSIGVQGPVGLHAEVLSSTGAEELELHALPQPLVALTDAPLVAGFEFDTAPRVALEVTRQPDIELTSTIIDELQASTMVLEDGVVITKMQLRMRNNTRQYLEMSLPESEITHCLIDGIPFRPGVVTRDGESRLMIPLHQSEVVAMGTASEHTVAYGETLSGIALTTYGDPSQWRAILNANLDKLDSAEDLVVGQTLKIPALIGPHVSARAFVVELAFRQLTDDLRAVETRSLSLPEVDVDVMNAVWHVYLPHSVVPLTIHANLTQLDHVHYGLARRVVGLVGRVLWMGDAWAGGYSSILSRRKTIYREEQSVTQADQILGATFPMVGEKTRFRRVLMGTEIPSIRITWISGAVADGLRKGTLFLSALLAILAIGGPSRWRWAAAAAGTLGLLVLADHLLGVHRRMVWGFDVGITVLILREGGWAAALTAVKRLGGEPWRVFGALRWRSIAMVSALSAYFAAITVFGAVSSLITAVGLLVLRARLNGRGVR